MLCIPVQTININFVVNTLFIMAVGYIATPRTSGLQTDTELAILVYIDARMQYTQNPIFCGKKNTIRLFYGQAK